MNLWRLRHMWQALLLKNLRLCLDSISLSTNSSSFTLTIHFTRKENTSLNTWWKVTRQHLFKPADASYLIHSCICLLGWPAFPGGGVLPSQLIIIISFLSIVATTSCWNNEMSRFHSTAKHCSEQIGPERCSLWLWATARGRGKDFM